MASPTSVNKDLLTTNFCSDNAFIEYIQNTQSEEGASYQFTLIGSHVYEVERRLPSGDISSSRAEIINEFATDIFRSELNRMGELERNTYITNLNTLLGEKHDFAWYNRASFTLDAMEVDEDFGHYISIRAALCISRFSKLKKQTTAIGREKLQAFYQTFATHRMQDYREKSTWTVVGKSTKAPPLIDSIEEAKKHVFDDVFLFERAYEDFLFQQKRPEILNAISKGLARRIIDGKKYNRDHKLFFLNTVYNNLSIDLQNAVKYHLWKLISEKQGIRVPYDIIEKDITADPTLYEQAIKITVAEYNLRKPKAGFGETKEAEETSVTTSSPAAEEACYLEIKRCITLLNSKEESLKFAPEASNAEEIKSWMRANSKELFKYSYHDY